MKKLLASLLIVCTLLACMMIGASAEEYRQDTVLEKDGFTKGTVWQFTVKPTDITGAVSLKFDLYVASAADFDITSFEIGTHGNSDWKEKQINGIGAFGTLVDGWNTVTLDLASIGESNDINPDDGTPAGFDFTNLCRFRIFNVTVDGKTTDIKFKNFVAVKEDGSEIKIGLGAAAKENAPIVIDALNYAQFNTYMIDGRYNQHGGGLYTDGNMFVVLQLPYEGEPTSALLKLPAGNGFLISASKDNEEFTEIARSTITGDLTSQDLELDLTPYLGSGSVYVKIEDGTPADGNGAYINGGAKKTEFSVSYTAPVDPGTVDPVDPGDDPTSGDDPNPGTFDAASSVAVFAVAALGITLVASKKRH